MPIADTGLIVLVGDRLLDAAVLSFRTGMHAASPTDRRGGELVLHPGGDGTRFADIVSRHVTPSWIELEVTETVLIRNPETIESTLRDLYGHGFRLAIDGFGTGYSSRSRLRDLPIDTLKIDKSFVSGAGEKGKDYMTVRAVAQRARGLYCHRWPRG